MTGGFLQGLWWTIWFGLTITSAVMRIVAPEYSEFILGTFSVSLVILSGLLFNNRKSIANFVKTSLFKNLLNNSITVFLVVCILGMVNYLAFKNDAHIDLTGQGVHTLSDQSKVILNDLDEKIEFKLFARRVSWDKYLNLINLYKFYSKKVKVNVIDIDTNPSLVQLNNIKQDGTVVMIYKGARAAVVAKDELSITNSIIKLLRKNKINVYYTVGHNEVDRALRDQNGGSFLFSKILAANYALRPLDLLKMSDVPNDANIVLVLGPQAGFLDLEIEKLDRYLSKGGTIFSTIAPNFSKVSFENFYKLLEKHGVKVTNSIVLDRLSTVQGSQATIPIITLFNPEHSVTKKFKGKVLMPLSSALSEAKKQNIKYSVLAKSNNFPGSWAETNFQEVQTGRATYDDKDLKGPIHLISVAQNTKTQARLMVSSSSSFIVNGYQSQSSNFNLFLNMLAWGLDDEGIISLNRPDLNDEMIMLSATQLTLIFYFGIAFIPFILFGTAILLYRRRLKK